MALTEDDLSTIVALLAAREGQGAGQGPVIPELRRLYPALTLTQCDASDVDEAPIRTAPGYDLHLLDAADHCAHVTSDLARATGLILARRAAP